MPGKGQGKLGGWVKNQRQRRYTMPEERRKALDDIGFTWSFSWYAEDHFSQVNKQNWEQMMQTLHGLKG